MRRLFIMRKDLNMSPGKLAAQVSHCAEVYWLRMIKNGCHTDGGDREGEYTTMIRVPLDIYEGYVCGTITKIVCEAKNKYQLEKAVTIAKELGLREGTDYGYIYDRCLTELSPEEPDGTTLTGLWFRPLPDDIARQISTNYQLYR